MIGQLSGKILATNPPEILLEVGNIGYEILCPMSTFYTLDASRTLLLHTHLSIKEDAHTLYGFISKDEKTLFRELIRVNGVGPKVALAVLSHLNPLSLMNCVIQEDAILLAKTPGIGKKTAQKIIVELKDRFEKMILIDTKHQKIIPSSSQNPNYKQAEGALRTLGFKVKEVEKMLGAIADDSLSTEELIRQALKNK